MTTTGSLPGQRLKSFSRRQRRIASLNIESTLLTEVESSRTQFEVLGIEGQFLTLASNPASSRKFLVLDSKTALFFDSLKMGQGHEQRRFVLKHTRELKKNNFWRLYFVKNLRICGRRPFLYFFYLFLLFFGEHFCAVSLVFGLKHSGPWPR